MRHCVQELVILGCLRMTHISGNFCKHYEIYLSNKISIKKMSFLLG